MWNDVTFFLSINFAPLLRCSHVEQCAQCKRFLRLDPAQTETLPIFTCGLKKPVIQKTFGRPSKHQVKNCAFLSIRSVNQKPRVVDSQDICTGGKIKNNNLLDINLAYGLKNIICFHPKCSFFRSFALPASQYFDRLHLSSYICMDCKGGNPVSALGVGGS